MRNPSPTPLLFLLLLPLLTAGCISFGKQGLTFATPIPGSPLPTPTVTLPPPPASAPDRTLYAPQFEDPAIVAAWARPLAPENAGYPRFTPDGRFVVYVAQHAGTRRSSLYSVPFAGGEPAQLGTSGAEEIFYWQISPDSARVIYYLTSGVGLYSSEITGAKQIRLTSAHIWEAQVSPDGEWAVYWGEDTLDAPALYSVPARGGAAVQLGTGLTQSESYQITPDSRYVVYTATKNEGAGVEVELYRVPIQGGTPVQLSQGEQLRPGKFLITPDSRYIIFGNLYRVSIHGGTVEQLNPTPDAGNPEGQFSNPPHLSPDGRWLVFLAGDKEAHHVALYAMALAGGPTLQLNGPLAAQEDVVDFYISPDSQQVFYRQNSRVDQRNGNYENSTLYSAPIAGGPIVAYPGWDGVLPSPDGRWLVGHLVRARGGFDLYSFPNVTLDAGEGTPAKLNPVKLNPVKLNTVTPPKSAVGWWTITENSQYVLYATSREAGGGMPTFDATYVVPIAGGDAHALTGVDGRTRVVSLLFAPDGEHIIADADYDGDGHYALYVFDAQQLLASP